MKQIDLDSLPESIRNQIEALSQPPKETFPVQPRQFSTDNFQTKEIKELGLKVDELIVAINELHKLVTEKSPAPQPGQKGGK